MSQGGLSLRFEKTSALTAALLLEIQAGPTAVEALISLERGNREPRKS
jgi:hypothetical protein